MNINDYVEQITKETTANPHAFYAGGVRVNCCDVVAFKALSDFSFIVKLKDGRYIHEKMTTAQDRIMDLLEWTAK